MTGQVRVQIIGLSGYHLLHLAAIDMEYGSKINLPMACKCVQTMLLDEKFLILGPIEVSVKSNSALIFNFLQGQKEVKEEEEEVKEEEEEDKEEVDLR